MPGQAGHDEYGDVVVLLPSTSSCVVAFLQSRTERRGADDTRATLRHRPGVSSRRRLLALLLKGFDVGGG